MTSHALVPVWPLSLITTSLFCVGAVLLEWFHQPNSSDMSALGAREDMIALSLMYLWLPAVVPLSSMIRPSLTKRAVHGLRQTFHRRLMELVPASDSNSLEFAWDQPNLDSLTPSLSFWSFGIAIIVVSAGVIPIYWLFGILPLRLYWKYGSLASCPIWQWWLLLLSSASSTYSLHSYYSRICTWCFLLLTYS